MSPDAAMPGPRLVDLGEDEVLRRLLDRHGCWAEGGALRTGPGDDCAVVDATPRAQLLKVDAVVEGVHWAPGTAPARVGRKALARVLSDVAAMGGTPREALVVVSAPSGSAFAWLDEAYAGMAELGRRHGVALAGGELVALPPGAPRQLALFLRGELEGRGLRRDGAGPGNLLAVTGRLGGSFASGRHLDFEPRLAEGRWLAGRPEVRAAMDLSDGLAADLPRLARASGVGAVLERARLPLHPGCSVEQALQEGEDHELLLAVDAARWDALAAAWASRFPGLGLSRIGACTAPGRGEELRGGWQHFTADPAS